jgi:hypothetical protein
MVIDSCAFQVYWLVPGSCDLPAEAYETLSNDDERALYDARLGHSFSLWQPQSPTFNAVLAHLVFQFPFRMFVYLYRTYSKLYLVLSFLVGLALCMAAVEIAASLMQFMTRKPLRPPTELNVDLMAVRERQQMRLKVQNDKLSVQRRARHSNADL